ncbi:MAG: pseudaminic acid synthase, partial [Bacteroidetes bacterium CG02_land_8_20_14_3_00_31_25]
YELNEKTRKSREFSRSLFTVQDIVAGEAITSENVHSIRPGYGLHPKYLPDVLGKTAKTNINKGTPLSWEVLNL